MKRTYLKYCVIAELCLLVVLGCIYLSKEVERRVSAEVTAEEKKKDYIKWVDFKVSKEALNDAYQLDKDTYGQEVHLNWIELLAFLASKNGGDFSGYQSASIQEVAQQLCNKEVTMTELTKELKHYPYYLEAYSAVLGGMVGEYKIEVADENNKEKVSWKKRYGLKAFSPIAKGYEYWDYDDFGTSRSYGYKRQHLGHDMMGRIGTPLTAIESGEVEVLGWNQYGGWRIGIRSFDGLRYYYYAHLRQNFPFQKSLEEGSIVTAGDVIGYMGHTGYSAKENVNNIDEVHLHWGLQLIFDESQKEGNHEIWVDCYALTRFLSENRSDVWKEEETKEYHRTYKMKDPAAIKQGE